MSLNAHLVGVSKKVSDHIADKDVHQPAGDSWAGAGTRWKFVASVVGAFTGLLALAAMAAPYFTGP